MFEIKIPGKDAMFLKFIQTKKTKFLTLAKKNLEHY